ncbi:zinc finger SWIM domain-containing protein 7 [Mucor lusitanicus]
MLHYSDEVIDLIFKRLEEEGTLTKETTLRLYSIFDKTLLESLQLTEGKQVTKVQSDSGRALYRVSNECISELEDPAAQEIINTCMINPRYCNCDKFIQDVILRNDMVMCRHVLAVKLSESLKLLGVNHLEDKAFAQEYKRWLSS